MNDVDLDKLEALAKAATPGPYRACHEDKGGCPCGLVRAIPQNLVVARCSPSDISDEQIKRNAMFTAATSPDVVLKLIAELRKARQPKKRQEDFIL